MLFDLFQHAGLVAYVFPLLLLASLVGSVVVAAQGLRGENPLGWLALAPLSAVLILVALNVELGANMSFDAIAHASAETKQTLLAAGISMALSGIALGLPPLHLPGLALMVACAVVGARRPHGLLGLGAAAFLVLVATACSVAGGLAAFDTPLRAAGVLVYGGMVLPALMGDSRSARLAGATAAAALPLLVAALEGTAIATGHILCFEAVAHASMETKATLMDVGLDVAEASRPWAMGAVGAALGIAAIGCARAPRGGAALFVLACAAPIPLLFDAEPILRLLQTQFLGGL